MHIAVSSKDDGQFCEDLEEAGELGGPVSDFCSPNRTWSYLRFYAMLIGDFELDDFTKTDGMIVLFVIFSLLGIIILLNMLIAVVSDSYQDAKETSLYLFGRSRVLFVAQNQALESLLRPGTSPIEGWYGQKSARNTINLVGRLLRWIVLLSLGGTALITLLYLIGKTEEVIKNDFIDFLPTVFMIFIVITLTFALWVFFLFAVGSVIRSFCPGKTGCCCNGLAYATDCIVKAIARRLFGLDQEMDKR